jgi:hypothetical protein
MPAPNYTTAQAQLALMEQVINENVDTAQNLDQGIDKRFQMVGAMDMGKEKYRHPIQFDEGGQAASYDPDGGPYIIGTGPEYQQFIVVPIPILMAFGATELLDRISKASGLEIIDPVARMISKAKSKMAHVRNTLAQGYNQFILATVDNSYAGGATVQLSATPFGNRLLDLNNMYAATDASGNYTVIGTPTVLAKSNSTGVSIDTIQIDAVPGGLVAGSSLLLLNATSGAPLGPQGMQYLISTNNVGDQNGISRALSQMQAAGVNANGATLTLGIITALNVRQKQNAGPDQQGGKRFYYTHNIQQSTAQQLGFAKTTLMSTDGKLANFDIAPDRMAKWYIGNQEVETDTMAATNTLYDVSGSHLRKVRYPGSQKFLPGTLMGYWWPRYAGGQATSERDMLYQDAYNFYTNLPWSHAVVNSLGVSPSMQVAV